MTTNTALLQTICTGPGISPPLDTYPADYQAQPLAASKDAYGYPVRDCGSYAMWMLQATGDQVRNWHVLADVGNWPSAVPGWLATEPAAGMIAIREPSGLPGDNGHAMFIQAVLPDGTLLVSSYNSDETGNFALAIWATTGTFGGVPFSLQFLSFPRADA